MRSPEFQAIMELAGQMAGMIQQQQAAMEVMLNSERGRPAAQAQGTDDRQVLQERGELQRRAGVA